jgi:hypothetical protein
MPAGEYVMFCNVVDAGVSHYGKGNAHPVK